jgi:ribosomal protein S13
MANAVRAYDKSCDDYVSLYHAACTAPGIGPNTAQAIVDAARNVEEKRISLLENCEKQREYLAEWLEENKDFSPLGPEHDDTPVRWEHFVKKSHESPDAAQEESETVDFRQQTDDQA